jgi:Ca-activated chloride channel family protein
MSIRARSGWGLGLLLSASAAGGAEPVATGASVVVVLDASSSMLGPMGKSTKMKVAREVTHALLKDWDPRMSVGLTAYGHRQPKSCEDIEAVVPLGPLNRKAFDAAVDRLKPRGKTPLAAALRNAAEQLGYAQHKATVIVVTDGIENCGGDPCAVAADLKQKGIDFTAHVVGLGALSAGETQQLTCIAEKTGGEYHGAKDAAGLKTALGGLVQDVEKEGGLRPPTVAADGAVLRELAELTSNVKIRAVRTAGGAPITTVWRIRNDDRSQIVGLVDQKSEGSFQLGPGKYHLLAEASNALSSNAKADLPFEIGTGKHHVLELAYNSGNISFTSYEFKGGPTVQSVFRVVRAGSESVEAVADYRSQPEFELFAGKYQLQVQLGSAKQTIPFEVVAGKQTAQSVVLDIGRVTLRAVPSPGAPPLSDTHWHLASMGADGSAGESAGVADYRSEPEFILAAGNYVARVEIDGGKKAEHRFSVKAGDKTDQEVVVGQ